MNPAQVLWDIDNKLRPPRHHARLWGKGRSRAAFKRRVQRNKLKVLRWTAKMWMHATNYGLSGPALVVG